MSAQLNFLLTLVLGFCLVVSSSDLAFGQAAFSSFASQELAGIQNDALNANNTTVQGLTRQLTAPARQFRQSSSATVSSIGSSAASYAPSAPVSKPFANVSSAPTISPYLSLYNTGIIGDEIDNYNTFVRPQLRQQQFNNQVRRQAEQINLRFQQLSAQPAYRPQGAENMMTTGHTTLRGYTGRFYPLRQAQR